MNKEMKHTFDVTLRIEAMMSMFRTEDKEVLLERIESLIYAMDEEDIADMYADYVETYPEMFSYLADEQADEMYKMSEEDLKKLMDAHDDEDFFHGDIFHE